MTTDREWWGDSRHAVDGNSNARLSGKSCSHTTHDTVNPWWRVDLGRAEPVTEVYIVNRDNSDNCCWDRLNPFEIRVGRLSRTNGKNFLSNNKY